MAGFKEILYVLAMTASFTCAVLLIRQYRATRSRLLAWSAVCFVCLSINNTLLFADLVLFPSVDLRLYRYFASLAGMLFLLYGFISDSGS